MPREIESRAIREFKEALIMKLNGTALARAAGDRMGVRDAAVYLGLSQSTLDKMRCAGKGPRYVRLGGRCFYRKADLDAYIEGSVVETADSRAAAA